MELYYILDNVISKKNDLTIGTRILKVSCGLFPFKAGDGPYRTLRDLRKSSTRYKSLQQGNPKRAQKICGDKFIINITNKILYPSLHEDQFEGTLIDMITHVILGTITKDNVSGIHFFNPKFHRILETTKAKNEKGIWEAKIEAKRPNKVDWVKKVRTSTFFPIEWTMELLVLKISEAFENKKKLTESRYIGRTKCEIDIVFIMDGKRIISVFPMYD
ncbi:MAG: EndoU domain-containing protein [Chitinophagaceae bacterium]